MKPTSDVVSPGIVLFLETNPLR